MPTQIQLRGNTTVTQSARTLAPREPDIDTTLWRANVHDGATPGGIPHANYADIQKGSFNYAEASGTNALTASFSPAPATVGDLRVCYVKAENNNTGPVTFNPDSLGATNVKKIVGGSKTALAADDVIGALVYCLMLDDTDYIISVLDHSPGLTTISQGDLNTSTGTFSQTTANNGTQYNCFLDGGVTLPGGQYGFLPQVRNHGATDGASFWTLYNTTSSYVTGLALIGYKVASGGSPSSDTADGIQRYITSSPPYDLGDGEAGGFIYLLVDKAGEVKGHYAADAPPWAYNGPTDIRATKKCPVTGKKFRRILKAKTLKEALSTSENVFIDQEITQAIKKADMDLIPQPFFAIPKGHKVIMLDPMDERVRRIMEFQNGGGGMDICDAIKKGQILADQEKIQRCGPKGVAIHKLKYK